MTDVGHLTGMALGCKGVGVALGQFWVKLQP